MNITRHIQWGNGTGVRLPKEVVEAAKLKLGQSLSIDLQGSSIVITPIEIGTQELPALAGLLEGVTPAKVEGEVNWGPDRGQERLGD